MLAWKKASIFAGNCPWGRAPVRAQSSFQLIAPDTFVPVSETLSRELRPHQAQTPDSRTRQLINACSPICYVCVIGYTTMGKKIHATWSPSFSFTQALPSFPGPG